MIKKIFKAITGKFESQKQDSKRTEKESELKDEDLLSINELEQRFNEEYSALEEDYDVLAEEYDALEKKYEALKKENEGTKKENEILKDENKSLKKENGELKKESETLKKENKEELVEEKTSVSYNEVKNNLQLKIITLTEEEQKMIQDNLRTDKIIKGHYEKIKEQTRKKNEKSNKNRKF